MPAFDPDILAQICAVHAGRDGALLPILHDVVWAFGHVDDAAIPVIARALNLSRAEVHGVVTFYHDFRRTPPAPHVFKICAAEACQSMGADRLRGHVEARLTDRADCAVENIYCLGLCSVAPAAMIDGRIVGRLDTARIDALIDEVAA